MEPLFKRVVRETAAGAASKATERFATRVDDLEDAFDRLSHNLVVASEAQDQAALEALKCPTHQNVSALMKEAAEYGALMNDQITVQATDRLGEFSVTLALHQPPTNRLLEPEESNPRLRIMGRTENGNATVTWHEAEEIEAPIQRLLIELTRKNAWTFSQAFSWRDVMQRLLGGVDKALKFKRVETESGGLEGRLGEIVAEGLFVTDAGLECPERSYLLGRSEFPPLWRPDGLNWGKEPPVPTVEKPTWFQDEVWKYALRRCSESFTMRFSPDNSIINRVKVPREQLGQEML